MLLGMEEVNKNNMVHRDLKPENVFIHNDIYKIADFGFCGFLKKNNEVYLLYFKVSRFDGWNTWIYVSSNSIRKKIYIKM